MDHTPHHGPLETWLLASRPFATHLATPGDLALARHSTGSARVEPATRRDELRTSVVTPVVPSPIGTTTVDGSPNGDATLIVYAVGVSRAQEAGKRLARWKDLGVRPRAIRADRAATAGSAVSPRRNDDADRAAPLGRGADVAMGASLRRRGLLAFGVIVTVVVVAVTAGEYSRSRPVPTAASVTTTTPTGSLVADSAAAVPGSDPTICDGVSPAPAGGCVNARSQIAVTSPVQADACLHLIGVAADALGAQPDDYARVVLAAVARFGQTLNDVVHQQLADTRAFLARRLENGVDPSSDTGRAASLNALDTAIATADATPCSARETPPPPPSRWPITEPP